MSVFESNKSNKSNIESYVKDFVIERMKKGEPPRKIKSNIKKMFGVDVSLMFVWRIRKLYVEMTGEYIKNYREFYQNKP